MNTPDDVTTPQRTPDTAFVEIGKQCVDLAANDPDYDACKTVVGQLRDSLSWLRSENERLHKACVEMRDALEMALGLIEHAAPKAFDNGVKDQTGTIDEGEVIARKVYEQIKAAIGKHSAATVSSEGECG